MPGYTERFTEVNSVTAIVPASRNNATVTSGYVSMSTYHRAVALINVGAVAAGGVLNAKLQQAKDTAGASAKDISGKAIVALDDTDDNTLYAIELRTEELDVDGRFDCIQLSIAATGAAAILVSGLLIRFNPRFASVGTATFGEVVD